MNAIDKLIAKKRATSKDFEQAFKEESEKLAASYALMKLREEEGLTQQQLAEKAGKPQSTIARIENGSMNVSFKVLSDIAHSLGKTIQIKFI